MLAGEVKAHVLWSFWEGPSWELTQMRRMLFCLSVFFLLLPRTTGMMAGASTPLYDFESRNHRLRMAE